MVLRDRPQYFYFHLPGEFTVFEMCRFSRKNLEYRTLKVEILKIWGTCSTKRVVEKYQNFGYYNNKYVDGGTMGWGVAVISACHSCARNRDKRFTHRPSFFSPISILSIVHFTYNWIKGIWKAFFEYVILKSEVSWLWQADE